MASPAVQRQKAPRVKKKRKLRRQRDDQRQEKKRQRPVAGVNTTIAPRSSGVLGRLSFALGGLAVAVLMAVQALGMPVPSVTSPGTGIGQAPIQQVAPQAGPQVGPQAGPQVGPQVGSQAGPQVGPQSAGQPLSLGQPAPQPNAGNLPQLGNAPPQPQAGFGGQPPPPQVANAPPGPPPVAPERTDVVQTAMAIPCISVNCDWWKRRVVGGPPPNFLVTVYNPLTGRAESWDADEFHNSSALAYWEHANGYEICSDAPPTNILTVGPDVIMHDLVDFEQMARIAFTPAQQASANPGSFGRSRLQLRTVQVEPNLALRTLDEGYHQLMTAYRNGADPSIQNMSLEELIRNGYIWIDNPNTVYWRVPQNFRYFPTSGIRLVHPVFVDVIGSYRYSNYSSPLPERFHSQALAVRPDGRVPSKSVNFVMDEPGSLVVSFQLTNTLANESMTIKLSIVSDLVAGGARGYNFWQRFTSGFFAFILPEF